MGSSVPVMNESTNEMIYEMNQKLRAQLRGSSIHLISYPQFNMPPISYTISFVVQT